MCGIVGALAFDTFATKAEEKVRTEASIFITTQLLQMTVDRGKDATGIAMLFADAGYTGLKMGIPSPDFIARFGEEETDFKGQLKIWREYPKLCRVFMGHCRKASKGNSYDNKNNHPLQIGDLVYVHNGTLTNDDIIFEKLGVKRTAEVDSEAIGHLLNFFTDNGKEPYTKEAITEVMKRLAGTYSVLGVSGQNPYQAVQFRDGRPAELAFVKPLKTVFIASEKKFLTNVLFEYNKMVQLFNAGNMPYLKKEDVEFKEMADESYLIWDLTTPITEETTIGDLYDWGKGPVYADKIWRGTTTTTYNAYNKNTTKKTTVSAGVPTDQGTTTKQTGVNSTDTNSDGMVWSKSLNKFKTQTGIEDSKSYGAVEISIDKGTLKRIQSPIEKQNEEFALKKNVDANRIESLITGAAKINDLAAKAGETALKDVKKISKKSESKSEALEIDMTTDDPEAVAKASQYVDNGLMKFKSDDEVLDALELSDISILKALPIYSLANRIMKFVFQKGFIVGFTLAKAIKMPVESITPPAIDQRKTKKLENGEKKIRTMKTVLTILASSLEQQHDDSNSTEADVKDVFMDALAKHVKSDALKRLRLEEVFSVGDLKNIPMLSKLKEVISQESDK